jgi:TolB protein
MNSYIRKMKLVITVSLLLLPFLITISAQEILQDEPRIAGVITEGREKIRLGLPSFEVKNSNPKLANTAKELRDVLITDLKTSGIFNLIPEERYGWIEHFTNDLPNFEGWVSIEAESLITGSLDVADDKLVFEGRVFDTKSKQMRVGRRYRGEQDQLKLIAHTFANEILRQFTGKKGFFNTQIVFVSDRTKHKELFISDFDGSNLTQITNLKSTVLFPSISPDKKSIYFTSFHDGIPKIYKVSNISGGGLSPIKGSVNGDITPAVSPDGKEIAFSSYRNGNAEIFVMNIQSGELERITYHYGIDTTPAWSPNGKSIIFTSDRSGMPNLYITDEKGLETTRLTYELQYCDHADWSPEGDRIVFTGRLQGYFNIFIKDMRNQELYQLTVNSRNNEDPSWSPDGRKIVFSSDRTGSYQLYIMNADGSDQRQITNSGNNTDPRWSK